MEGQPPPDTMSEAEQLRVKVVASQIAASANPARFQQELLGAVKSNPNFAFMQAGHAHHNWYNYCVGIYRTHNAKQRQKVQTELLTQQMMQQRQQADGGSSNNNHTVQAPNLLAGGVVSSAAQPFYGDFTSGTGKNNFGGDQPPAGNAYNIL